VNPLGWSAASIPLTMSVLAWIGGDVVVAVIVVAFQLFLNLPHQYGTWRRIITEDRLADHSWPVMGALVAIVLIAAVLALPDWHGLILGDLFVYWGLYHLAAQNWGISRILTRQAGAELPSIWLDRCFFGGLNVLVVLWGHATTTMTYTVLGQTVVLQRIPLTPDQGHWMATALVTCAIGLLGWRARCWSRRGANRAATIFEMSTVLGIGAALAAPSLLITIVGLTAVHNVQYVVLVDRQQRGQGFRRSWRDLGFVALYVSVVIGIYWLHPTAGAAAFAILVSWHYLADSRLWRPSQDRRLGDALGISQ
jgi:hypothetical protein